MTVETARPVRVTIDGWLTDVLDSHGKPTAAVRVRYDSPTRAASILLLTDGAGVQVEARETPREWCDGDVVVDDGEGGSGHVWVRRDGVWHCVGDPDGPPASDAMVNGDLANGLSTVLRYQAGEES